MRNPGGISDRQNGRMSQRDFMSAVVATAVLIEVYRICDDL
jgi:tellurite resistance protein